MNQHFSFSHTINVSSDDSEQYEHLFKIGGQRIEKSPISVKSSSEEKKYKKVKKAKKQKQKKHKQKKEKKEKKEKKRKQQKKQKNKAKKDHERQILDIQSDYSSQKRLENRQVSAMQRLELSLKPKHQQYSIQPLKTIDDILRQQFKLNQSITEKGLKIDIIKFGNESIYRYGYQDREISKYERLRGHNFIVGMKKNKKAKKIIKQMNKMINQKPIKPTKDDGEERYFHFKGYENLTSEKIETLKSKDDLLNFIDFRTQHSHQNLAENIDDKLKRVSREYNKSLIQNPQNIEQWLNFIDIQDKIGMITMGGQSQQLQKALGQRKMSIIMKALSLNPKSEKLALACLQLMQEMNQDRLLIQSKNIQFLQSSPYSLELWIFYFNSKVSNFVSFCHTRLQKDYEQTRNLLEEQLRKSQSGAQVSTIRKISLVILNKLMRIFKMEGYEQLSTAILIALAQFNLFTPSNIETDEQRYEEFKKYWQTYQNYHVGQLQTCCWANPSQSHQTYIQLWGNSNKWLPSHSNHHQNRISTSPQSFIFYEDIKPYLYIYRSRQNLETILDILMNCLEMPTVYGHIDSELFGYRWLGQALMRKRTGEASSSFLFWKKYWNPSRSEQYLGESNICKFIYGLRVCSSLLNYHASSTLYQYVFFFYCVVYTYDPLRQYLSREDCLEKMNQIIGRQPNNLNLWAMYIETEASNGKSYNQCLDCFLQCLCNMNSIVSKLWVLYWIKGFVHRHNLNTNIPELLLNNVFGDEAPSNASSLLSGQQFLSDMDKLLLSSRLKQLWSTVHKSPQDKCIVFYFLLLLGFRSEELIQQMEEVQIGRQMIMELRVLDADRAEELFQKCRGLSWETIKIFQYWLNFYHSPILNFYAKFDQLVQKNYHKLFLWLYAMRLMWPYNQHDQNYPQYFLFKAKQIITPEPECLGIVNCLVSDPIYTFSSLSNIPYHRLLYQRILQLDPTQKDKINNIMLQKQLRH